LRCAAGCRSIDGVLELLGPRTLVYFYRRRLRAHRTQELLAGVGIAAAVALVFAAGIAQGSIVESTRQVLRAVIGPADLQLRARGPEGFPQALLGEVEAIPGVVQAAPLLERNIQARGSGNHYASVYVAGTDTSLGVLDGLGRTLPLAAYKPGTIALSAASARALGIRTGAPAAQEHVMLRVDGVAHDVPVSAVLGEETVGVLARAHLAVMPLATMQALLGERGRVSRILVHTAPGRVASVRVALAHLAAGRLAVSSSEQDIDELRQALHPAGQASTLFAVIGALLGFLFAFNAILMTVPERRQAIADLRLAGTRRSTVLQLHLFQALCLGVAATTVGLGAGYLLSLWGLHQSTGYLAEAFALDGGTVVPLGVLALAAGGGVLVTCAASSLPLLDLRRSQPLDAVYIRESVPGNGPTGRWPAQFAQVALALLVLASTLYATVRSAALLATVALALATVLVIPSAFGLVLRGARAVSERAPRLSTLAIAIGGVRGTTLRSIALAATGAVALFGSVALGGARSDLLSGIRVFAHSYAADAPVWVSEPQDNQATGAFATGTLPTRLERLPGVARVRIFRGSFLTLGRHRVWVIARPPGAARSVLSQETIGGPSAIARAQRRLAQSGWIVVSEQIAAAQGVRVGGRIALPTPAGTRRFRVAALTSNLAWSPGVVFMSTADYARAWDTQRASALAVFPVSGASTATLIAEVRRALGPSSGLEVVSAATREAQIDTLTAEGLGQLGEIAMLLVLAAILALAAALASSINQRRRALAELRLAGARPSRLRRILLVEAGVMLSAGCVTGALAGVYGQFVIDAYLRSVTGFPVAAAGTSARPLAIFVLVLAATLFATAIPAWLASRVSPTLALAEE
jgi:putative ABC transport system permease protein